MKMKRFELLALLAVLLCGVARDASAFYNSSTGKWLSRDPVQEHGEELNLFVIAHNDVVNRNDKLGLWETSAHHQIIDDWLIAKLGSSYTSYRWHGCCIIDVGGWIKSGTDDVDGVLANGWPWFEWCEAQSSANSYQHAMRNGAANESVEVAAAKYGVFMSENIGMAIIYSSQARNEHLYGCENIARALFYLGRAYHSYSDSLSPAHAGFQAWWGPIDGYLTFGAVGYLAFVEVHAQNENDAIFQPKRPEIRDKVARKFNVLLDYVLQE